MTLEAGDHLWYWNGKVSPAQNIPQHDWFGTTAPNDYGGNGKDIYNYVVYADEVVRGRPHMRNFEGSFSWLNNNPGNITGQSGGPDFGQFPGKFNWHNFLIFPTWEAGFAAIAQLLRGPRYVSLSLTDAFARYAPGGDGGNSPAAYAQAVADAVGVDVSATVGDLSDDQMLEMQNKITEIEGAVAGESFAYDAAELPDEIKSELS
jgi:hypothetical protein